MIEKKNCRLVLKTNNKEQNDVESENMLRTQKIKIKQFIYKSYN